MNILQRLTATTVIGTLVLLCQAEAKTVDVLDEEHDNSVIENNETGHEWLKGELGIYYEFIDYYKDFYVEDGETVEINDSNLVIPFFQVNTVTPGYIGFSVGAGLTGYAYEQYSAGSGRNRDDYSKLLVQQLYLQYDISRTRLRIGRLEVEESLLLRDYYEAFTLTSGELTNVYFLFVLAEKVAESDINKFIEFQNVNRNDESIDDYLYAVELSLKTEPELFRATFYYYHQGNLYQLYGTHVEVLSGMDSIFSGVAADMYASDEDSVNGLKDDNDIVRDGNIYHINPFFGTGGIRAGIGYIEADREVGAREGDVIDDYFNPFNEGNKVYDPDAKTWYVSVEYESDPFETGLVYGRTGYLDNGERLYESEAALSIDYELTERFRVESEFSVVNSESIEGNYRILEIHFLYRF